MNKHSSWSPGGWFMLVIIVFSIYILLWTPSPETTLPEVTPVPAPGAIGALNERPEIFGSLPGSGNLPAEASKRKECYKSLGECGYPDPAYNDVGYESNCALLESVGAQTLDTPHVKVEHKNIKGPVYIGAEFVTLKNDCIETNGEGKSDGSYLVNVTFEGGHANISHVTMHGKNQTTESVQNGIVNDDNASDVTANFDYIYWVGDAIHNDITVENSYLDTNGEVEGEHYEDVYCQGTVKVIHDTVINPHSQTAAVFCNTEGGAGGPASNHVTVEKSFLMGGGYVLYPQGNATSFGTGTMTIRKDNIARCITPGIFNGEAYECEDGADEFGLYHNGGYYGVAAYIYCPPETGQIWEKVVWDNNDEEIACP